MDATELCYTSLRGLATLIQRQEVSPVEATRAIVDRVEKFDRQLNSFITLLRDEALAQAHIAEQEIRAGRYRGPLHGVPIAVEDGFYTKGMRTTMASNAVVDAIPSYDATVLSRLYDAGAILIGKLNRHESTRGAVSASSLPGPCSNPWDQLHLSGGPSSGCAVAVATGLCFAAVGADAAGSIRIPAALCGIVALKPTYGRVSRHGIFPVSWSLDQIGPLARTVTDVALTLQVIAGHDRHDPTTRTAVVPDYSVVLTKDIEGARLGLPQEFYFEQLDPDVRDSVRAALQRFEHAGAQLEEVSLPWSTYAEAASRIIALAESAEIHEPWLRKRATDYTPELRARLLTGQLIPATHYLKAQRVRSLIRQEMAAALRRVDALVTPSVPFPAPRLGQTTIELNQQTIDVSQALSRLTRPANLAGFPAVTLPCGVSKGGLPIGLQLTGRPFSEATILRLAYAYEQDTAWHQRRPLF